MVLWTGVKFGKYDICLVISLLSANSEEQQDLVMWDGGTKRGLCTEEFYFLK